MKLFFKNKIFEIFLLVQSMLLIFIVEGHAQTEKLRFEHLTVLDGLSQNWVRCIYQDKYGFLWFGTDNGGINKYDAYKFKVYKHDSKNVNSLKSNTINLFFERSNGELWVGTQKGINVYDVNNDRFVPYPILQDEYIIGLYEFKNGKIIVVSDDKVYLVDPKNESFRTICAMDNDKCIDGDFLTSVIKDKNNNLWVGSSEGLCLLDTVSNLIIQYLHDDNDPNSISGNIITRLCLDNKDRLWVGTRYKGISIMQYEKDDYHKPTFYNIVHNPYDENSISEGAISSIYNDVNGNMWIGTENGGLNLLKTGNLINDNYIFQHYMHNPYEDNSISSNSVYDIYEDNQGTIWIGTFNGGLNYYNRLLFEFEHVKPIFSDKNSLNNNFINIFYEDGDDLLIGTEGGLNIYNRKTKRFRHYVFDKNNKQSLGSNAVWSILKDSQDNIWIGTWAGGLNLFNREKQTFKRFLHDNNNSNSILSNNIFGIIEDNNKNLWIACMNGGLSKFNYSTNTFSSYKYDINGNEITSTWIRTLLLSSYNEMWISNTNSIQVLNLEKNELTTYRHSKSERNSISYNGAVVFFEDSKKNMWIGTEAGLNRFNRIDSSFTYYQEEDGLPNNVIEGILEDNHGNLWISTNKGISKFIGGIYCPSNAQFINYDVNNGLQDNEFNRRSCLKDKDGRLYFGGFNGYNVFFPDSIKQNKSVPEVVLTDFLIFNQTVDILEKNSPLKKHISVTEELILTHKHSVFNFEFTALNYLIPEKNQFAYIMKGFEKEWNYVGNKREATYTNLDPGEYVFKVIASNNDNIWNKTGTELKIKILPPWWQTYWFKILAIVFILTLIAGFYFYRINSIKKRNIELEKIVKMRTKELQNKNEILIKQTDVLNESNVMLEERQQKIEEQQEELISQKEEMERAYEQVNELNKMKDRFFSIIGHDLKNPINIIMGFSDLLMKRKDILTEDKKDSYIKAISTSARNTFNLLENLLDWARSQSGRFKFNSEEINLNQLVQTGLIVLKEQYRLKNLDVQVKINTDHKVSGDRSMLEVVFRNLISNAIKFSNLNGEIVITSEVTDNDKFIKVCIYDGGIGISKEKIENLFRIDRSYSTAGTSGETGTGLGLILCSEFVSRNGGEIWVESEPGKGSVFIFTIPKA